MHPLEKKILNIIRQEDLLQRGEKVLVAVSAGPDSMALLHILARLAPDLNISLAAAYVDHGLRPAEARKEKALAAEAAQRLGIAFFAGNVDVKGFASEKKLSLEHAARELRYDFLATTAQACSAGKIGLAHTADDQAEEILLRLIRGTARKGLSGMKTLRAGKFIRPLLRITKSRLLDYLEKYKIPFLIDSSNQRDIFLRNRIRNELLPHLAAHYNPDIRRTLNRTANILQDEEELLESMTASAFAETCSILPGTAGQRVVPERRKATIQLKIFQRQPRAVQRRLLEKCCWLMACEPRSRQIEDLLHLAGSASASGSLHLADGLRASKKNGRLRFEYPQGRKPLRGELIPDSEAELPETRIPGPGTYDFPRLNRKLVVEYIEEAIPGPDEKFPAGDYLDAGLFSFPLTLRSPATGDRFHPLGAPGSKKVAAFLSDRKIARNRRRMIPVLTADDSILALPGLRVDHRFRITAGTTRAVRVRWEASGVENRETKGKGLGGNERC